MKFPKWLIFHDKNCVKEVALVGAAVRERKPALDRVGERKSNPALDLRMKRVRVDHEAGIDGAEHALDRQPPADAGKLRHLRDIGFEPPAAADVAIVGNAPNVFCGAGAVQPDACAAASSTRS